MPLLSQIIAGDRAVRAGKALGLVLSFVIAGVATSASAHNYDCPRTSPGTADLCGNPEFQSCLIDVEAPDADNTMHSARRQYCIHVPDVQHAQSLPVVFGFHGGGQEPDSMVRNWQKHTEQGMVLVFPRALMTHWSTPGPNPNLNRDNPTCHPIWRVMDRDRPYWSDFESVDASCGTGWRRASVPHGHDLAMVEAIAADIVAQGIARQGLYAVGFSSGASMVRQLFLTERTALMFDGFATVGNGITAPQIAGENQPGSGSYLPNTNVRRPILIAAGTSDKSYVPWDNFIATINEAQNAPAEDAEGCSSLMNTALEFHYCYRDIRSHPDDHRGVMTSTMVNSLEATLDWFVAHNASVTRAYESLYPDLGHGSSFGSKVDATVVVRQDFPRDPQVADSAAVTVITIVNGRHGWPGVSGNAPPCSTENCDIDFSEVVLQFWRANAGFVSEWH